MERTNAEMKKIFNKGIKCYNELDEGNDFESLSCHRKKYTLICYIVNFEKGSDNLTERFRHAMTHYREPPDGYIC